MKLILIISTLFAVLMVEETYAADAASDSILARKFSPILILTEETVGEYGGPRRPGPAGGRRGVLLSPDRRRAGCGAQDHPHPVTFYRVIVTFD